MKTLSIALIALTKFTSIVEAKEIQENDSSEIRQEQGEELFQELMERVSPNEFREVNESEPDMSFRDV